MEWREIQVGAAVVEVRPDQGRTAFDDYTCPACGRAEMLWVCRACSGADALWAVCECGQAWPVPHEPAPCPNPDRHDCCHSWRAAEETHDWLPLDCAARWCGGSICVCLDACAPGCAGGP
jgi:hypothetical protein